MKEEVKLENNLALLHEGDWTEIRILNATGNTNPWLL